MVELGNNYGSFDRNFLSSADEEIDEEKTHDYS